jgi:hypothetical protein
MAPAVLFTAACSATEPPPKKTVDEQERGDPDT